MTYLNGGKHVSSLSDIPEGEHYAIMYVDSIFIPGDERSRTYPGHGYPESTEAVLKYVLFKDKMSWEAEIAERATTKNGYGKSFVALKVVKAKISTTVSVKTNVE
jgi:hypothetical protein